MDLYVPLSSDKGLSDGLLVAGQTFVDPSIDCTAFTPFDTYGSQQNATLGAASGFHRDPATSFGHPAKRRRLEHGKAMPSQQAFVPQDWLKRHSTHLPDQEDNALQHVARSQARQDSLSSFVPESPSQLLSWFSCCSKNSHDYEALAGSAAATDMPLLGPYVPEKISASPDWKDAQFQGHTGPQTTLGYGGLKSEPVEQNQSLSVPVALAQVVKQEPSMGFFSLLTDPNSVSRSEAGRGLGVSATLNPSVCHVGDPHPQFAELWQSERFSGSPVGLCKQFDVTTCNPALQTAQVEMNGVGRSSKRGPFKDPIQRQKTAQTRKMGCCMRCRRQRIRCDTDPNRPFEAPCLQCQKSANSLTAGVRLPCLRWKLSDIVLNKSGPVPGFEWTRRWTHNISVPIQRWANSDVREISIADNFSMTSIRLRVREFVPQEGDKLTRTWDYRGTRRSVSIPPFALVDLEHGKTAYELVEDQALQHAFDKLLGPREGLIHKTYMKALDVMESTPDTMSRDLLKRIFRLWTSIRLSTTSGFIVGPDTLGMQHDVLDETSPDSGKIPVPPVLGAQLDLVLIHHIQAKLRREVLDILSKMIVKKNPRNWFVIYLVSFILLHNAAMITQHDAKYARKHGIKRRFAREDAVRKYFAGANIVLAHFHEYNRGLHPFAESTTASMLSSHFDLGSDEMPFVLQTRAAAKTQRDSWDKLYRRGAYEDDYFYVSQLFEENWTPRDMKL